MAKGTVSQSVIRRLPRYYRFLRELEQSGTVRISSGDLARRMGLTASQIRQDLNCFGGFGQQGYGYNVRSLYEEIGRILGLGTPRKAILIGAGNLGRAVTHHMDFASRGFELIGIFDSNPAVMERFSARYPKAKCYESFEQILSDAAVDAVHLVTPIPLHADHTVAVLESGKHCACTVPMATSLEDIARITEAKRKSGKKYMMMETTLYT